MKKGKVFGKGQIALAVMLLALGAAVWLNMKFSSTKYLGEATFVNKDESSSALETGAKVEAKEDYFETARKDRENSREEQQEIIDEILDSDKLTDEDKASAVAKANSLADMVKKENSIETLLKGKGFEDAVAIVGDEAVDVVVKSDGLTTAQTLQIQDIVTAQTNISLGNIKIVAVK